MPFLEALAGNNRSGRPPIWLMRQAGRYMHEYMALRAKYDFYTLCHTPELVCEVTKQPIDAFGFDAAILFSDILWILEALGAKVLFDDAVGPIISGDRLVSGDTASSMQFVTQSIRLLKKNLTVPLIGFAGGPFTVASYFIEKKSSHDLAATKKMLQTDPEGFHQLIDTISNATIDYLNSQIEAGVDAVQIFDSWAMHLSGAEYDRYVVAPLQKILSSLKACPTILFCRGSAEPLFTLKANAISLDWLQDLKAHRVKHPKTCLQGNFNPDLLLSDPTTIRQEATKLLDAMKGDPAYIFNLGHGVHKNSPRQHIEELVKTVQNN